MVLNPLGIGFRSVHLTPKPTNSKQGVSNISQRTPLVNRPFMRKSTFCFSGLISKDLVLERMFIFTGQGSAMDKLLNIEYKLNPSNRSGASEAHMHTEWFFKREPSVRNVNNVIY
jgi:hypothetical protein